MKRVPKQLAEIAVMPMADLRVAWKAASAGPMPTLPEHLLRRLLAQHVQERRYGRLPASIMRELERIAAGEAPAAIVPRASTLAVGTRLIREWNGRTISVEVLEEGFGWDGRIWRSLSEIARAVTGAHWSGPRFFGLKRSG